MHTLYEVIRRPIISEKSTALAEVAGRYVFEVSPKANKYQIKEAVQKLFNVKVLKVHTLMMQGKLKRVGRFEVKRPQWKKALITLPKGQSIDLFQAK